MKLKSILLLLFALLMPTMFGCSGGGVKKKLIGKWDATLVVNGEDDTDTQKVEFQKDGTFVLNRFNKDGGDEKGTWQVQQEGKEIKLSMTADGETIDGTITFDGNNIFVLDPPKDNKELEGMQMRFKRSK